MSCFEIRNFRCNQCENPIGVDRVARFRWEICGGFQKEYSLTVYDGNDAVYTSGKTGSGATNHTVRTRFRPMTVYRCVLTAVSEDGREAEAESSFRTALTDGFDRRAEWIGMPEPLPNDPSGNPATYYRKRFSVEKITPTFAYLCGLGLFELTVNGKKAGENVLDCPFTDYQKKVLYRAFDLTPLLREGENTLEVTLGDGWYNQTAPDVWNFCDAAWREDQKLIFEMHGAAEIFSDETWECSFGTITNSVLRLGEQWCVGKAPDDSRRAVRVHPPKGKPVSAEYAHPIRVCEEFAPVSVTPYESGYLCDFGQNLSGVIRFRSHLSAGQTVKFHSGEVVENGRVNNTHISCYVTDREAGYQTDSVTAAVDCDVEFQPKFVYHGFRWVEVEGVDHAPTAQELTALFIHSDFDATAHFRSDRPALDRLFRMSRYSMFSNFVGFPTDCPHREKNGWTGDAQLSSDWLFEGFDPDQSLYKWMEDIEDSRRTNGMIACIAPTSLWGYDWGTGPAWDFAYFRFAECFLRYRDDPDTVRRFLPGLEAYFAFLETRSKNGLFAIGLGDWCPPLNVGMNKCPVVLTSTCYAIRMAELLSEFSETEEKKQRYAEKAERYRKNLEATVLTPSGVLAYHGLTALSALLFFRVVRDKALEARIYDELLLTLQNCGYHYYAGILGVKFLNRVLCERGRIDLVVRLLETRDYPSFLYWVDTVDATTFHENYESNSSRNHHMFCDVAAVLLEYALGVRKTGLNRVTVAPDLTDFASLHGAVRVAGGEVLVDADRNASETTVTVTIPGNTHAELVLYGKTYPLSEGTQTVRVSL